MHSRYQGSGFKLQHLLQKTLLHTIKSSVTNATDLFRHLKKNAFDFYDIIWNALHRSQQYPDLLASVKDTWDRLSPFQSICNFAKTNFALRFFILRDLVAYNGHKVQTPSNDESQSTEIYSLCKQDLILLQYQRSNNDSIRVTQSHQTLDFCGLVRFPNGNANKLVSS